MNGLLQKTEEYIKEKLAVCKILQKMEFEVNGLLRQTKVPLKVTGKIKPPSPPKLSKHLQSALLNIKEVYGCGTLYGKLTIHVNSDATQPVKEEISKLLRTNKYSYGYNVERMDSKNEHAGGVCESGNLIRTQLSAGERKKLQLKANTGNKKIVDYKYGSLGCYVMVRPKSDGACAQPAWAQTGTKENIFGVTCAHVVADCEITVQLNNHNGDVTVPLNNGDDTLDLNNDEGIVELNNGGGTVALNTDESTVELNNDEGAVELNTVEGTVEINNDEGTIGMNNDEGTVEMNNDEGTAELNNGENTVEAQIGHFFYELGKSHSDFTIYDGQRVDVAVIKINPERVKDCDRRLKKPCGLKYSQCSLLYEGDITQSLEGKAVYKIGPVTNKTDGIIISQDYQAQCMEQLRLLNYNFSDDYTILIEDEAGYTEPGQPGGLSFTKEGDSGSVICLTDEDDGFTRALSILQGDTVTKDAKTSELRRFAYSCQLKKSLQELGDKVGCDIELAT